MTIHLYTHPACLDHDTGSNHAERPQRLTAVMDALQTAFPNLAWKQAPRAERDALLRVHAPALVETILKPNAAGITALDPDTMLSPGSAEAALRAAGAATAAVDSVCSGTSGRAFCAVRPPGHHATADTAMGFCLFNSIAVAAMHAIACHGLGRVSVVDFDVHHGNGSQDIFAREPRVQYISSHQWPLYPGTGTAQERGVGNLFNAPLPPGTQSEQFRSTWRERLLPAIDQFAPELLLISAGFDAHWRDPLAQFELEAEDFGWLSAELCAIADRHAAGRLVSLLEGGYDLQALAECAIAHVGALLPRDKRDDAVQVPFQ